MSSILASSDNSSVWLSISAAIKRRLRRMVAATSTPPLLDFYRSVYRVVISVAVLKLKDFASIKSIYVTRSCATGNITPGISDIDFQIIVRDDSGEIDSIRDTLKRFARLTGGLIEYYPRLVQTEDSLKQRWLRVPAFQHRYLEGKQTWKLLHGADLLGRLPDLTEQQRRTACYLEMVRWWVTFANNLLRDTPASADMVVTNSLCFKTVTELLNCRLILERGSYGKSRKSVLERIDSELNSRLSNLVANNFLGKHPEIIDDTLRFAVRFFIEQWAAASEHPFLAIYDQISQSVDCLQEEIQLSERFSAHIRVLIAYLESHWPDKFIQSHTVQSAFWQMDEFLFVIDVRRSDLPTVAELRSLTKLHDSWTALNQEKIFLFVRVGAVIFPLTPQFPLDLHRGVLTASTHPDVFLQLGENQVNWSDYSNWFLTDMSTDERWSDMPPVKRKQLQIISEASQRGFVIYPLTEQAIERASSKLSNQRRGILTNACSS